MDGLVKAVQDFKKDNPPTGGNTPSETYDEDSGDESASPGKKANSSWRLN